MKKLVLIVIACLLLLADGALAAEAVKVKVVLPDKLELMPGEKVKARVVVEAGEAKVSAIDIRLAYNSSLFKVEKSAITGKGISEMPSEVSDGVVGLAGVVMQSKDKLPSGTFELGYIDIVGKANAKIGFNLKQMELVGYEAGRSEPGVRGEFGGVMVDGESAPSSSCTKAGLDLSGEKSGVADGKIDLLDYSFAKTRAVARSEVEVGGVLTADFNGDCMENMADLGLMIREIVLRFEDQ
jgi:hypothetical protein